MMMQTRIERSQNGASLIEILATVLILSFGLLALAAMQSYVIAVNTFSANRTVAIVLANDLVEMLRANRDGFTAGGYDRSVAFNNTLRPVRNIWVSSVCTFPACTPANMAADDVAMFQERLKAALPAGDYRLVRNAATNSADIWIFWAEQLTNVSSTTTETSAERQNDNCPAALQVAANSTSTLRGLRCFYMSVAQ
jgi:type IV pilus assembly protein PilV